MSSKPKPHDDDCATLCPIPPNRKCNIGHGCWCTEYSRDARGRFTRELSYAEYLAAEEAAR